MQLLDVSTDLLSLAALVLGGVSGPRLGAVALLGEENEVRLVLLKASDVLSQRLL